MRRRSLLRAIPLAAAALLSGCGLPEEGPDPTVESVAVPAPELPDTDRLEPQQLPDEGERPVVSERVHNAGDAGEIQVSFTPLETEGNGAFTGTTGRATVVEFAAGTTRPVSFEDVPVSEYDWYGVEVFPHSVTVTVSNGGEAGRVEVTVTGGDGEEVRDRTTVTIEEGAQREIRFSGAFVALSGGELILIAVTLSRRAVVTLQLQVLKPPQLRGGSETNHSNQYECLRVRGLIGAPGDDVGVALAVEPLRVVGDRRSHVGSQRERVSTLRAGELEAALAGEHCPVWQLFVALPAVDHRFERLPVVARPRGAERPADHAVALLFFRVAHLELPRFEADHLAGLHGDCLALLADVEQRRPLLDVEHLLLVVVCVEPTREGVAGFEFEVVHREVLGPERVRDGTADLVDLHRADLVADLVDVDFLHAAPIRARKNSSIDCPNSVHCRPGPVRRPNQASAVYPKCSS